MTINLLVLIIVLFISRNSLSEKTLLSLLAISSLVFPYLTFNQAHTLHLATLSGTIFLLIQDVLRPDSSAERKVIYLFSSLICLYEVVLITDPLVLPFIPSFTFALNSYIREVIVIMCYSSNFSSTKSFMSPISKDWRINVLNLTFLFKYIYLIDLNI